MKSHLLLFIVCSLIMLPAVPQQYIPYEILQAVENGTRTFTGLPGENYFQNHADYNMEVRFDPASGNLAGSADITYYNESPDTLTKIVMRLYQNIYKKGGIRDDEVPPEVIHDGVLIKELIIDKEDYTLKINQRTRTEGTNFSIFLHNSLVPSSSCLIHIEWEFTMPNRAVKRYGKYGDGNYFVGLWYPQIAVYDDIDGWDELQYTGTHEFYNDFNNFYVSITVPRDFMVWATGAWINAEYILSKDTWNRFQEANASEELIHIITPYDIKNKKWYTGKRSKTFRYKAENIPDFAFAISNNYLWDAVTAWVGPEGQHKVLVSAAYAEGSTYFNEVAALGKKIIQHLSDSSYGIPYPYSSVTIFNGGGGMEYPMMVNNGTRFFLDATIFLTMHEVAHAYFPFQFGINERKYSWIDEGLTTFLPMETQEFLESDYYTMEHIIRRYNNMAGSYNDIPLSISGYQTRGTAYENFSYIRSAVAFYMLENYIGRDTFRLAIRNFAKIWQFKHPTPYDLLEVITNTSHRDVQWFIDQWFFSSGWPDLAIGNVKQTGNKVKIEVLRQGLFPVPVLVELQFLDGTNDSLLYHPENWKGKNKLELNFLIVEELESIKLGSPKIPDKDPSNNVFTIPVNYNQ